MTGEHAVVYDAAAIVVAIDLHAHTKIGLRSDKKFSINLKDLNLQESISISNRVLTEIRPKNDELLPIWQILSKIYKTHELTNGLNIEVWSDIPIGVGLGSSAAIAVATAAALDSLFELHLGLDSISQLAYEGEKVTHGTPSGIDNAISTYGGAILFKKRKINRIEIPFEIPLLIINSGISRTTKTQVSHVKHQFQLHPTIFKHVFNAIDEISLKVDHVLRTKKIDVLGELMDYNQHLLQTLGVSTKELNSLIDLAKSNGALGAKLTGAGGGGCIIALFDAESTKKQCINQLQLRNIEFFDTKISQFGVQIHHTLK